MMRDVDAVRNGRPIRAASIVIGKLMLIIQYKK